MGVSLKNYAIQAMKIGRSTVSLMQVKLTKGHTAYKCKVASSHMPILSFYFGFTDETLST